MEGSPPAPITGFDVELRQRHPVGADVVPFEVIQRRDLEILDGGVDPHEA